MMMRRVDVLLVEVREWRRTSKKPMLVARKDALMANLDGLWPPRMDDTLH